MRTSRGVNFEAQLVRGELNITAPPSGVRLEASGRLINAFQHFSELAAAKFASSGRIDRAAYYGVCRRAPLRVESVREARYSSDDPLQVPGILQRQGWITSANHHPKHRIFAENSRSGVWQTSEPLGANPATALKIYKTASKAILDKTKSRGSAW
jgi:hypothetical protein